MAPVHCEPIENAMVMLRGAKRATLVGPASSPLLRPTVSPDGRAYFVSNWPWHALDPTDASTDPSTDAPFASGRVPRTVVDVAAGDLLWIPTWTWHRVDYGGGAGSTPALGASFFSFRPAPFVANNPLFAVVLLPNLFKELLGLKQQ